MTNHEWMTADQAAEYLGLPTRKALYQAVRRGDLPGYRFGAKRLRFRRDELDAILRSGRLLTSEDILLPS